MNTEKSERTIPVFLEIGNKRTFAGGLDWPGWCRSGRNEASALAALVDCGSRYAAVLNAVGLAFKPPEDASGLSVVERLPGNVTTDFGAPDRVLASDAEPLSGDDLQRQLAILDACWRALATNTSAAEGMELRKGPRGGGRELEGIRMHVIESASGYLGGLGRKFTSSGTSADLLRIQAAYREAIETGARDGVPVTGPRGGAHWKLRYFIRRSAWHILDHAWEIEDRIQTT